MKDSLFRRAIGAFFAAFAASLGVIVAIAVLIIIFALGDKEDNALSSSVTIRPDADGHRKELSSSSPVLLEIPIVGEIGKDQLTADKVEEILLRSREKEFAKDRVKGILLIINSPGGGVTDSNMIYNYLLQYKERHKVPIFAYVDGMCASGGLYIACAADKIYASDSCLIGSVGVISWPPFFNVVETIGKLGIQSKTVTAGKGKDEMNPFRPWKEGEESNYQETVLAFYDQFVDVVAKGRSLKREDIIQIGAKVFPTNEAKQVGYIDEGNVMQSEALKQLALQAGIKEKYQVVTLETKSWWKKLVKEKSPLVTGKMQINLPEECKRDLVNPFSYIFIP